MKGPIAITIFVRARPSIQRSGYLATYRASRRQRLYLETIRARSADRRTKRPAAMSGEPWPSRCCRSATKRVKFSWHRICSSAACLAISE